MFKHLSFSCFYKDARLLSIHYSKIIDECTYKDWSFHLFPKRFAWRLGHSFDQYDSSILEYYGGGPLFLLAIMNW